MKLQVIIPCTEHRNIVQGDRSEWWLPTVSSDFGPCPSTRLFSVVWHREICFWPWTLVIHVHAPKISSISQGELHVALKCWSLRHNAHWNVFLLTENDFKKLFLQFFWNFSCIYFETGTLADLLCISFTRRIAWKVDGCIFRNLWTQKLITCLQFFFFGGGAPF